MEPVAVKTEIDDSATNPKKEVFQCPQCDKVVQSSYNLKTHTKWIHDLVRDRHMCDICCKTFAIPKDLNNHQKVHTGEKNFPCHICGKSYKTKDYLIRHTRIHTGERPFSCDQCGKSFSDPSSFKVHRKRHTDGDSGFPCTICGTVLMYEKSLKLHMSIVHQGSEAAEKVLFTNEFKVDALKKVKEIGLVKTSHLLRLPYSTLRNWIKLCQGGHKCKECNKIFPYGASLKKHIVKKHSSKEDPSPSSKRSDITSKNQQKVKSQSFTSYQLLLSHSISRPLSKTTWMNRVRRSLLIWRLGKDHHTNIDF